MIILQKILDFAELLNKFRAIGHIAYACEDGERDENDAEHTFFYSVITENAAEEKKNREIEAAGQLKGTFSEFDDLHNCIADYENRTNPEAWFVYAHDKIVPIINFYLDDVRLWKSKGISLEMVKTLKRDKIAVSPEAVPYFNEIILLLESNKERLFNATI